MSTYEANQVLATREYDTIGKRPVRHDGPDKVTGKAQYGADIRLPGLLHARTLQSPHAHARINKIDASRALALSGVRAVVTAADLAPLPAKLDAAAFNLCNALARE